MSKNFSLSLLTSSVLTAMTIAAAPSAAFADDANSDEIIVTGSPLQRSADEAITGVSVLSGEELASRLAGSLGETLKNEPGVSSTFFGAGASRPIIRGQGGGRVRILVNGVGSIDAAAASPDHAVAAEPAQAQRIEVVRGASLLRFGSSGSGGVVNVIDGRIPDRSVTDGITGNVRIGASTADSGGEAAASVMAGLGELAVFGGATFREAADFRIPTEGESLRQLEEEGEEPDDDFDEARKLDNSQSDSFSLTGGISFLGGNRHFGVSVSHLDSAYGIPGGHAHGHHDEDEQKVLKSEDDEEEEEEADITIDLKQTRFDVNGQFDLPGFFKTFQFFGGYADYEHTELEGEEIGTVFSNEGYELRAELVQAALGGWEAAHGIHFTQRDFAAIGAEAFVPPVRSEQFAAFTFHQLELDAVHLEGALRFENHSHDANTAGNPSRSFDLFSVSGGGDFHVNEVFRLGGTVFRTERAPSSEELFSNGPHLATGSFEIGNPDLKKEIATGAEAALRFKSGSNFVTLNVFYTDYSDYISQHETGAEMDELPVFEFESADANFKGFEAQAGTQLGTFSGFAINVDALAEYVEAKAEDEFLPRIPPLSVLAGIEARADKMRFRAEIDYADVQNKLSHDELKTNSYTLLNLSANFDLPSRAGQKVSAGVSVNNLFDSEARQHTSFLKDVLPLPGRNIRFSLRAAF